MTELKPVDATQLRRVVEQFGDLRPDFLYTKPAVAASCLYTHALGNPGCVIGHGLAELGSQIPYTHEWNAGTGVLTLYSLGFITGAAEDRNWLSWVQDNQDNGYRWGEAVERANAEELRIAREKSQQADDE